MTFDSIYQYNFPTTVRFGAGSSKELGDYLIKNNLSRPLIVTDPVVAQLGFFRQIVDDLKRKNISVEVFHDIHKNPVKSDVYKGSDAFDATKRDSIVGIGGRGLRWMLPGQLSCGFIIVKIYSSMMISLAVTFMLRMMFLIL
ncbi:MAG: iron-containing alcohol dehydrogenase [Bacteroidota bacterium]